MCGPLGEKCWPDQLRLWRRESNEGNSVGRLLMGAVTHLSLALGANGPRWPPSGSWLIDSNDIEY